MINEDYKFDITIPTEIYIDHDGDEKYIIVSVISNDNGHDKINKYVLLSLPLPYHADIVDSCNTYIKDDNVEFDVLGGGILTIDRANKFIKTYGTSGGYGPPPKNLLTHIINTHFPDWEKEITITSYIRG